MIIYDVTDKADPKMVSQTVYPQASYTHQGYPTEDAKHFVFDDELDGSSRGRPAASRRPAKSTSRTSTTRGRGGEPGQHGLE